MTHTPDACVSLAMPIIIETSEATKHADATRSWTEAMARGARLTCPACGQGALIQGFLTVNPECPSCGEELHHHRADDAPPYFTIFIVGHVVLAGVLALEQTSPPPIWVHMVIWLPLTVLLCALVLPRIKGALIGLQWAHRMHGFGDSADDPSAPDTRP
ncbi:MAG: DUF983 domain-containing protein [Hyphomicrobiaceae bacterium]